MAFTAKNAIPVLHGEEVLGFKILRHWCLSRAHYPGDLGRKVEANLASVTVRIQYDDATLLLKRLELSQAVRSDIGFPFSPMPQAIRRRADLKPMTVSSRPTKRLRRNR